MHKQNDSACQVAYNDVVRILLFFKLNVDMKDAPVSERWVQLD